MDSEFSNIDLTIPGNPRITHTPEQVYLRRGFRLDERETISLNGTWRCMPDPENIGDEKGYFQPEYDVSGGWFNLPGKSCWREVTTPCKFSQCGTDVNKQMGVIWFRKDFDVPQSWSDKCVVLRLSVMRGRISIWINGTSVMQHHDAISDFELDISDNLNYGSINAIVVKVDRTVCENPFLSLDGDIGSIELIASNRFNIRSAEFEYVELDESILRFELNVSVLNKNNESVKGRIFVEIVDGNGLMAGCYLAEIDSLSPGEEKGFCIEEATDLITSVSTMYTAHVYLLTDETRVDYIQIHTGGICPVNNIVSSTICKNPFDIQENIRQKIDLAGEWRCIPDFHCCGEDSGFQNVEFDQDQWRQVKIPCIYDNCGFDMRQYEGQAWFRKEFIIPTSWQGMRNVIRLEGIHWRASIWLNGRFMCEHLDGLLRFDLDISEGAEYGKVNTLVIRTDNTWRLGDRSPGSMTGYFADGGITREIEAISMNPVHLVSANFINVDHNGQFTLKVKAQNDSKSPHKCHASIEIMDSNGNVIWNDSTDQIQINTGSSLEQFVNGKVDGIIPWSPDNPSLYTAKVTLLSGDQPADCDFYRFGFRSIEVADGKLLLNGERIFLYGTDLHEDSHRTGMTVDLETLRRDIIEMKRTGINFVRMAHAPRGPSALELYDELGMMVLEENNLHWWMRDWLPYADVAIPNEIGPGNPRFENTVASVKRQLTKMIERDMNHPSIIIWSVGNENPVDKPGVQDNLITFLKLAKELDPSRPVVHVSCSYYDGSDDFTNDDIICINGYFPNGQSWRDQLTRLHGLYPDKPIMSTEFGFVGILGEHKQAQVMESQFSGMTDDYVCGACVYSWVDVALQEWENAYPPVQGAYGIASRWREKREAVAVVRCMYAEDKMKRKL
ncbi:MAG: glycoside hydrolase family 2 TIM barrel-domain containing protein [Armatimonadota bacterium]